MPLGEPKCGVCGSDLMSGMFHTCKPSWDEENATIRAELERWKSACAEYYQAKEKLTDELKAMNLQNGALREALESAFQYECNLDECASTCGNPEWHSEAREALSKIEKRNAVDPLETCGALCHLPFGGECTRKCCGSCRTYPK